MNEDTIVSIGFAIVAFLGVVLRFLIPLAGIIIGYLLAKKRNKRWMFLLLASFALFAVSSYFFIKNYR